MAEHVKIRVDLTAGTVDVDAPLEALDSIFSRLESFIPQMSSRAAIQTPPARREEREDGSQETRVEDSAAKVTAARKRGGGKGKETYNMVSLPLNEDQRKKFRELFKTKQPSGQNDQTLVIMMGLQTLASMGSVTKHDIYSGFRLIDGLKVPGKISSVLGNLVGLGTVQNVATGTYKLTHVGEDRVNLSLPVKKPEKE